MSERENEAWRGWPIVLPSRFESAWTERARVTRRGGRSGCARPADWSRLPRDWLFLKAAARRTERGARCLRTETVDWASRASGVRDWPAQSARISREKTSALEESWGTREGRARATPTVRSSGWKTLKWGGLTRSSVPEGPATVRVSTPLPLAPLSCCAPHPLPYFPPVSLFFPFRSRGAPGGGSKQRNDQRN